MKWNWKGIEVEGLPSELIQLTEQKTEHRETKTEKPTQTITEGFKPRVKNRRWKSWTPSEHKFLMENWLGRESGVIRRVLVKTNKRTAKILRRTYFGCSVHWKKHRFDWANKKVLP